jgi:two-component system, chemotaxis family, protein-glutamate methylesterase/glutaminase
MIKLLIVDDSALMRRQLTNLFQQEGDFLVRQARNGKEAVEENRDFLPDVVSLDINMPEMDGITALSLIMAERPVPVVMVSSLTEKGALATFEALNLGAVDYIAKPGGTISLSIADIKAELVAKMRTAARARLKAKFSTLTVAQRQREAPASPVVRRPLAIRRGVAGAGLVVIGVSTGGPRTLEEVLPLLPADYPWPVLVAQHMPAAFTKSFAERLDTLCPLKVVEVSSPMSIEPGTIYIAKGGADMVVVQRGGKPTVIAKPEAKEFLWHPSVELLGRSVLEHYDPARVTGVMLTGMGYDGADAFSEIKKRGGKTIAESEETAVVFGMPAELIERGGASLVLPLEKIATQLNVWAGRQEEN